MSRPGTTHIHGILGEFLGHPELEYRTMKRSLGILRHRTTAPPPQVLGSLCFPDKVKEENVLDFESGMLVIV